MVHFCSQIHLIRNFGAPFSCRRCGNRGHITPLIVVIAVIAGHHDNVLNIYPNRHDVRYPMWIEDEYPEKDGEIMMTMGHAATSASNICAISNSQPLYIVKCGDKFYHKAHKVNEMFINDINDSKLTNGFL